MILRLRTIFNQAINWLDSTGFSVFVAPYILYKYGSDLGIFRKVTISKLCIKNMCIYSMDLRKINFEHVNKMNSSRIRLEADNDI